MTAAPVPMDPAVARKLAHDLRGATSIVAGALREIEAGSEVGAFINMARRATARLERLARSLDALGGVFEGRSVVEDVDIDAVVAACVERIRLELRQDTSIGKRAGAGRARVDRAAFVAGVDEVLAVLGKRGTGVDVDGGVVSAAGFDHVPASARPFEDPLGTARLLLETAGGGLTLHLAGNVLSAHLVAAPTTTRVPAADAGPLPEAERALEGRAALPLPRVLLVDDDDDSAGLLGLLLSQKGYAVTVARSVREAAAAFAGASFDVVVTDHELGDGDARDVLQLRGAARGVVLTGHTSVPIGPETLVLTKPVDVPRLLGVLARAPT